MIKKKRLDSSSEKRKKSIPATPLRNTLEIIGLYSLLGILWIFFSDRTLEWMVGDPQVVENLQTAKGIFYVLVTAYLFYVIIKRRMNLYFQSITDLNEAVEKLEKSNTDLRTLEEKLYNLAYFDHLTGLLSKNKLIERIEEISLERPDENMAFVYIDIDDFKNINESKGHDIGDHLIQLVAKEIQKLSNPPDEVARIGGDEFVLLIRGVSDKNRLMDLIRENTAHIRKSFLLAGEEFFVTVSAGISLYPEHGRTFQSLIRHADLALITAKQRGKSQIVLFEEKLEDTVLRQIEITNMLHPAIPNGEIFVYYQPIMDLRLHRITSVEALLRWKHPARGFIPPLDFIPIAEKSGLIHDLTWFVIGQCFRQQKIWVDSGISLIISINLSAKVLSAPGFIDRLRQMVESTGISPNRFAFEITESVILDSWEETLATLDSLKEIGFRLDLDDFGTGYSSLTYLNKLPVDIVKLDRGFIKNMEKGFKNAQLLQSVIHLAHELKLLVVSEGVENIQQLQQLESLESDFIQGYYYAKPMPADQIAPFLARFDSPPRMVNQEVNEMELLSVMKSRFSVRNFSDQTVEEEKILQILEAGRLAPTAKNFRPHRIYLLRSSEALAKVRAITKSAYNAPLVMMICAEDRCAWVNPITGRNAGQMDASIVATHMMLRATDLGIGSVWVCWVDTEALKKAFSLPEGIEPYCLLPIGYPASECVPNPRHFERRSLQEIVTEL